jgi:cell wall-associated NlpC family hydrolase
VPSALVSSLTAPIRELQAMLGTGSTDPATALSGIHGALTDLAAATGRSWQGTRWMGEAGDAAAEFTSATVAAIDELSITTSRLGAAATNAADAVSRARQRLRTILDEFEARAETLEAELDEPGTADELIDEGRRALAEAEAVVDELRAELDGHQAAVREPGTGPVSTTPMGAAPGLGSVGGSGAGGPGPGGLSGWSDPGSASPSEPAPDARPTADPAAFGSGVGVQLPDGSTATAPNAVAASAVRHALTQLGVPYHWGGTTPGVGLDCSGLTQWAYHEAGLDLPRLAQEQDIGSAVNQGSLRPGDLAVWDGHVAMIVGNGLMVEAGDPVKLSAVRTTNAGQGFQGFWRPTA